MDDQKEFPQHSFVLARLLVEPLYREDGSLWSILKEQRERIVHYFRQIGQELIVDDAEGYAFLRQIETDGEDRVPRIGRRQVLGYSATILLVCLREELARFDSAPGDSARLVFTRQQLQELVGQFLKETTNQIRDQKTIDSAISRAVELKFLRPFGSTESDTFEVMRILKARFGPSELEDVRKRLAAHVQ